MTFRRDGFNGPYTRITDAQAFAEKSIFGADAFRCETPEEIPSQDNWHAMTQEERMASNAAYEAIAAPCSRDIARNDADLVAVVELMGSEADGECAKLKVIDIPDGTHWEIKEYDGLEHVAELHATWR